jgi:hypothetical protein
MPRVSTALFLLVALVGTGCASVTQQLREGPYDKRAKHFEQLAPHQAELSAGKLDEALAVLKNIEEWIGQSSKDLAAAAQKQFEARMVAASRRYRIAVASAFPDPVVGLQLALPIAAAGDPEADAALRMLLGKVKAVRQAEQQKLGTYQRALSGTRTSQSMSVEAGQKRTSTTVTAGADLGNCVVATQKFGSVAEANPGFDVRFQPGRALYVRCFTLSDLSAIPAGAKLIAKVDLGSEGWDFDLGGRRQTSTYSVDFMLEPRRVDVRSNRPLNVSTIELSSVWAPDNVVVVDRSGRLRVRPDWRQARLATGGFVIDRALGNQP